MQHAKSHMAHGVLRGADRKGAAMARPRKDANTPEARQRIVDAFWELLEDNRLHDITVHMIVSKANCNRGTFYYHYADIDELVYKAIEREFYAEGGLPNQYFELISGDTEKAVRAMLESERIGRLGLAIRQGGLDLVEKKLKAVLVEFWKAVLCPNGEELAPRVRVAIEYNASGILSLIAFFMHGDNLKYVEDDATAAADFLREFALFMFDYIVRSQDLTEEEVIMRVRVANESARLSRI